MTTSRRDSAHPHEVGREDFCTEEGLTKREYFAAHAPIVPLDGASLKASVPMRAAVAVAWADALIAELNK